MKKRLRSEKLLERLNHHPAQKSLQDDIIVKKILKLASFRKAKNILFYLPIHGEVDLCRLFESVKSAKKFILPKIRGNELDLHYIQKLDEVEEGVHTIPEPLKHLPKAGVAQIDLVLVPGIVFAENGHRIGFGKGFYDRLLKKTRAKKIGIAYQFQIVKNIAGEAHDVPMDMIVTDQKIIRVPKLKKRIP